MFCNSNLIHTTVLTNLIGRAVLQDFQHFVAIFGNPVHGINIMA